MLVYDESTGTITMIAKDTGSLILDLENYNLDEGDTVYFTVNTELEKEEALIQKRITEFENNVAVISLSKIDTDIPVGKYYYDIQVNTADGRVDTVVGPYSFKIKGGVTY